MPSRVAASPLGRRAGYVGKARVEESASAKTSRATGGCMVCGVWCSGCVKMSGVRMKVSEWV